MNLCKEIIITKVKIVFNLYGDGRWERRLFLSPSNFLFLDVLIK